MEKINHYYIYYKHEVTDSHWSYWSTVRYYDDAKRRCRELRNQYNFYKVSFLKNKLPDGYWY